VHQIFNATGAECPGAGSARPFGKHYAINVLKCRGEKPLFEAVSRDGGNPYWLISADAREIWAELKTAARAA
jgi:hypothetical protein